MRDLDLNDFRHFVRVVEAGGFSAAARGSGVPRSRISRRIAALEEQLGLRLIQRSTRAFAVSDIGREFYEHCKAMLIEAEAAAALIERQHHEPQGLVRIACPPSLVQLQVGTMLARFMADHPKVAVRLESTNRQVDVLRDGFDLAIRVRFPPLDDSDLVIRRLGDDHQYLVAARSLLEDHSARLGRPVGLDDLSLLPSLSWDLHAAEHEWDLHGPEGDHLRIRHEPRLVTPDMLALVRAVEAGIGVCRLPARVVRQALETGRVIEVVPGWRPRSGIIHAVFPSRRGLIPSVRLLIDNLAQEFEAIGKYDPPE